MCPVNISGREYATVAERLALAHGVALEGYQQPVGIHSITTEIVQVGHLIVVQARVTFNDGRHYEGMSAANLDSRQPAERDAPVEVAETSAVGRALAFAGYPGSEVGIAGAEEIQLAQRRSEYRKPDGSSQVTDMERERGRVVGGATPAQIRYLETLWQQAKRNGPIPDVNAMPRADVSRLIDELRAEVGVPPRP